MGNGVMILTESQLNTDIKFSIAFEGFESPCWAM